jgi:hypothetical protein
MGFSLRIIKIDSRIKISPPGATFPRKVSKAPWPAPGSPHKSQKMRLPLGWRSSFLLLMSFAYDYPRMIQRFQRALKLLAGPFGKNPACGSSNEYWSTIKTVNLWLRLSSLYYYGACGLLPKVSAPKISRTTSNMSNW